MGDRIRKLNKEWIQWFTLSLCLLGLVVLSLITIIFVSKYEKKDTIEMMDALGRQQVLIQSIKKDSGIKYALLQSLEQDEPLSSEIKGKFSVFNSRLESAKVEFESKFATESYQMILNFNGNILQAQHSNSCRSLTKQISELWVSLSRDINIVRNTINLNEDLVSSMARIEKDGDKLADLLYQLSWRSVEEKEEYTTRIIVLTFAILIASACGLVISILRIRRYILVPIGNIHRKIYKMGMLKSLKTQSDTPEKSFVPLMEGIDDGLSKLNNLVDLLAYINSGTTFPETLQYIYDSFSAFIPYSHIGVALLKEDGKMIEGSYAISGGGLKGLAQKLVGYKVESESTSLIQLIHSEKPRIINDFSEYVKKGQSKHNLILKEFGVQSSITYLLQVDHRPLGFIFFTSEKKNVYKKEHLVFLKTIANSISISFNDNILIEELLYSSTLALAKLAESRDEDTGDHLERISIYARDLSRYLKDDGKFLDTINYEFIKNIEKFAPMHDIGKVAVGDDILLKPGKLTPEEFEIMKTHAIYGEEVLSVAEENIEKQNRSLFHMGMEIAGGHHEKWDGSGYPRGRVGEEIPLSARIVAVVDVFDALTSKRPYKKAFPFDESFQMIIDGKGKHFDPDIVDTFVKHRDDIYAIWYENHVTNAIIEK